MPAVPLYWNDPEDLALSHLAKLRHRERPKDEVHEAERLAAYATEFRTLAETVRTLVGTGLYGRTAIDRQAENVASARYRETRRSAD